MATNSIYLVLDMINDLVHPSGPNGQQPIGEQVRARNVIVNTRCALDKARMADVQIGYVRVGFSSDYRECPSASPIFSRAREQGLYKLGTWGTQVHPDLVPLSCDFDIVKHRVSPFYGTSLEPILRAHGIGRIYLSGVSSNAVVQATVREGHDRDYECIVIEDCCASFSFDDHSQSMKMIGRFAHITSSLEVNFK